MVKTLHTRAGVEMPTLIYGTAWKKEQTAPLVEAALRCGFRGIDTACQPRHYHEAGVGEALEVMRAEGLEREALFLQTKFTPVDGQDPENTPYDRKAALAEQVRQSFRVSQDNLRTDYVDSYVLHSPLFPFSQLLAVWRAMETIAKEGNARQLGISNCYDLRTLQRLFDEAEVKPAVLQNRFYADSGYDVELRAFCDANAIRYQSFWSLTANPHLLGSEPVIRAAMARRIGTPQIFYAYLIAKGITPLDGTTSSVHMQEDLHVPEIRLAPEEIAAIDRLLLS
ncbi:aldo/keto reductase [Sulfurimonas sp. HSL1-2]|uniref:aldo/keto reductase family protein n=1 Tax=Thiomicrolovo zhangzhouensis TaxID=3131933 RepID=UPI0031F9CF3A